MKKALVAGATGYLGRYVVQEFKKYGFWIRAPARNNARIESLSEYIDEKFNGEVTNPNRRFRLSCVSSNYLHKIE